MKKRSRRNQDAQPPVGLLHLFAMVRDDSENPTAAPSHAQAAYSLATEILDTLFDNNSGQRRYEILDRAEATVFPHMDPPGDAEPEAAFYVGMATAYLLMMRVGGAR